MSQHDYVIANQTFPATRTDINNALGAVVSTNAGATAPTTTYAYQLWYDTGNDDLKMRNADNDAWIALFSFDQTADTALISGAGGITFPDSAKAIFGAGSDLQLYSDGTDGHIDVAGALTVDVSGDINLDADGGEVNFQDGGTTIAYFSNSSSDLLLGVNTSDKDLFIQGNDGGSTINALQLDMSAAGYATFNAGASFSGTVTTDGLTVDGTASMVDTNEVQFFSSDYGIRASSGLEIKTGDFIRFLQGATERLRITSTGKIETTNRDFGFHNHGTQVTLADDAFITINGSVAGGGLLAIYDTASGGNALFRVGYGSCAAISGAGGVSFSAADTDGAVCIFSSGHNIYIKNRLGGSKGFFINMLTAGNNFAG